MSDQDVRISELEQEVQALRAALIYANTRRGHQFDWDEWHRLVEHALSFKNTAPNALENEIACHNVTRAALESLKIRIQKEQDDKSRSVEHSQ